MQDLTKTTISLTEQYDGWIKKIVRRMFNKFKGYYPYEDLLSTAYLASVEAEQSYNPERAKFSAYIKPRIEGAILRSVSNITNTQHTTLQQIYRFIDDYIDKHGRVPAQHIILKHVGITEAKFMALLDATLKVSEVPIDDMHDYASEDLDLDVLAEYSSMLEVIGTLSRQQRDRIAEFIDDPDVSVDKISDIVSTVRSKLNIEED